MQEANNALCAVFVFRYITNGSDFPSDIIWLAPNFTLGVQSPNNALYVVFCFPIYHEPVYTQQQSTQLHNTEITKNRHKVINQPLQKDE